MVTKQNAIDLSSRFVKELIDNGIPLQRAILFGSYASGMQKNGSDIDLALFSNAFTGIGFLDKKIIGKWNIKPQYIDIEVSTFSTKDDDPFIQIIENTGLELFSA